MLLFDKSYFLDTASKSAIIFSFNVICKRLLFSFNTLSNPSLRDEGVDSVLKEKSRRLQITLKENIIADLDAVSRKYGLSKSNIIAMLSNKYLKEEFGDYKNN